jgi:hypothetical protein
MAAGPDGRWEIGIGDPTPLGWITVAAYAAAAVLAWRNAGAARRTAVPHSFWIALTALMLALGINKQLDLQTWLSQAGRDLAIAQGWWEQLPLAGAARFNIAQACCAAGQPRATPAHGHPLGARGRRAAAELRGTAGPGRPPGHALRALGVRRGDRVAIVMPQRPRPRWPHGRLPAGCGGDAAVDAVRARRAGQYRLQDSGAGWPSSTRASITTCWRPRAECPPAHVLAVGGAAGPGRPGLGRRAGRRAARFAGAPLPTTPPC